MDLDVVRFHSHGTLIVAIKVLINFFCLQSRISVLLLTYIRYINVG